MVVGYNAPLNKLSNGALHQVTWGCFYKATMEKVTNNGKEICQKQLLGKIRSRSSFIRLVKLNDPNLSMFVIMRKGMTTSWNFFSTSSGNYSESITADNDDCVGAKYFTTTLIHCSSLHIFLQTFGHIIHILYIVVNFLGQSVVKKPSWKHYVGPNYGCWN